MFVRKWSLSTSVILGMNTTAVFSILTYDSIVWRLVVSRKYNAIQLNRIQGTVLKAEDHVIPLHLPLLDLISNSAVRLLELRSWPAKCCGHTKILDEIPRELWPFPKDYATRKLSFKRNFEIGLPLRTELRHGIHYWRIKDGLWSRTGAFSEVHSLVEQTLAQIEKKQ